MGGVVGNTFRHGLWELWLKHRYSGGGIDVSLWC